MRRSSCFTSPSKMPASAGDAESNGPPPWASLPLRSAHVSQDWRDDPDGTSPHEIRVLNVAKAQSTVKRVGWDDVLNKLEGALISNNEGTDTKDSVSLAGDELRLVEADPNPLAGCK
jgi:hypothetical protein